MRLNKEELIKAFTLGYSDIGDKSSNLEIKEEKGRKVLYNYNTIIAGWESPNQLLINDDNYSSTTTRNQNLLKEYANDKAEILPAKEMYDRLGIKPDWRSL